MTEERSKETESRAAEIGRALLDATEFAALRERLAAGERKERALATRIAIQRSMLEVVGLRGWAGTTVEEVVEHSGSNRARFYVSFGTKGECYASAYGLAIEALAVRLLGGCEEAGDWASGMRRSLTELAIFIDGEQPLARGLLVEATAAGAAVAARHDEIFGRLSRVIDHARRETSESRHPVPPFTSRFILGGIEGMVAKFLGLPGPPEERSFAAEVPGLVYLAVDYYRGSAQAREQMRRLTGGESA